MTPARILTLPAALFIASTANPPLEWSTNSGILTAVDAKTGTSHYQNQRLDEVPNVFASPVSARGRIYFPGREGTTLVVKSGPTFEVLARNTRDDGFTLKGPL